jgi:hypothetical protein
METGSPPDDAAKLSRAERYRLRFPDNDAQVKEREQSSTQSATLGTSVTNESVTKHTRSEQGL